MRDQLNKKKVMIEILEPPAVIFTLRRKKFVRARVLQVGSEVNCVQAGDHVICYNEGSEIIENSQRIRILNELGVALLITQ